MHKIRDGQQGLRYLRLHQCFGEVQLHRTAARGYRQSGNPVGALEINEGLDSGAAPGTALIGRNRDAFSLELQEVKSDQPHQV